MVMKVLIVEDDPLQQETLTALLQRQLGYAAQSAGSGRAALEALQEDRQGEIHLVILDLGLPDMSGMEVLDVVAQRHPGLPVIMLTGQGDIGTAVEAMKAGACDFLTKPPEKGRLRVAVQNALKISLLEKEVSRLKRREEGAFTFAHLIGHDGGLAEVVKMGRKASASDIPVLLTGETGTGKEVFARAIHGESHRVGKPFVAVNCGALPAQLVESILFGHEKGAFTGAITKSPGKFREAHGGTIFLDEIGELPLEAQVKLLRVLQQKEVAPVGAGQPVPVDVRIISATNRRLEEEVAQGRFRDDLFFRLSVLPIRVPALRDRRGDIPDLVRHFIESIAASEKRPLKNVSPRAMETLCRNPWPGNVRELENVLHRAMILSEGDTLEPEDFSASPQLSAAPETSPAAVPKEGLLSLIGPSGVRPLSEIEKAVMEFSVTYHGGNITRAAADLGMAKSTFYRRLKEFQEK